MKNSITILVVVTTQHQEKCIFCFYKFFFWRLNAERLATFIEQAEESARSNEWIQSISNNINIKVVIPKSTQQAETIDSLSFTMPSIKNQVATVLKTKAPRRYQINNKTPLSLKAVAGKR